MRLCALLVAILSASAIPAQADVAGMARVIDGDTIVINGEHVRLRGIDAPETDQTCHARDKYGRLLAVCHVAGESLNERIVREGWALNFRRYSTDYLDAEDEAERNGAGIWRGEFIAPWVWRRGRK